MKRQTQLKKELIGKLVFILHKTREEANMAVISCILGLKTRGADVLMHCSWLRYSFVLDGLPTSLTKPCIKVLQLESNQRCRGMWEASGFGKF